MPDMHAVHVNVNLFLEDLSIWIFIADLKFIICTNLVLLYDKVYESMYNHIFQHCVCEMYVVTEI